MIKLGATNIDPYLNKKLGVSCKLNYPQCPEETVTPDFKEQNQASHMCAQEVHTYNNKNNNIKNNVI